MDNTPDNRRWRDRVKDSIKEREIKKTVVSHWSDHKETYVITALCTAATYLLTKKSTSSVEFKQFSLYGGNSLVITQKEDS